METVSIICIIISLILFVALILRGGNIFVVSILLALFVAFTGGMGMYDAVKGEYMAGFTGFIQSNFLVFLTGALMGKAYEITNGAKATAQLIIKFVGKKYALFAVPIAIGILTYGGIAGFVVCFAVYPITLEIFREANLPRRFIPAVIIFGCCTFSSFGPGTPQVPNVVIANALGTSLMSGALPGFISMLVTIISGLCFLHFMVKKAKANGEGFNVRENDTFRDDADIPNGFIALLPLIVTIICINLKVQGNTLVPVEFGIALGAVLAYALMRNYHKDGVSITAHITNSIQNALVSVGNTSATVAFGTVVAASAGFQPIISAMTNIPGPDLIGAAIATNIIAGIAGGASGSLGIAGPLLGPIYSATVNLETLHRVMVNSAHVFGTLPHNGFVVTVTNGVCKETYKDSYGLTFLMVPLSTCFGLIVTIALYLLIPGLS